MLASLLTKPVKIADLRPVWRLGNDAALLDGGDPSTRAAVPRGQSFSRLPGPRVWPKFFRTNSQRLLIRLVLLPTAEKPFRPTCTFAAYKESGVILS